MKNINRREFVKASIITAAGTTLSINNVFGATAAFQFSQIKLPYDYNALEPSIDATTMDIHYNKHHAAYVKNINDAIAAENIAYGSEAEFFANASKLSAKARNNSGGVWNHNFFWQV